MNKPNLPNEGYVLAINGGSSSIKFSLLEIGKTPNLLLSGMIENIDTPDLHFHLGKAGKKQQNLINIINTGHKVVIGWLINWLETNFVFATIKPMSRRVVYSVEHTKPEKITEDLLNDLKKISDYDPEHLPEEIRMIEVLRKRYPSLFQIACFDTSFHTTMPAVAKLLAIPRRFNAAGIKRYGFHGLSYAYLMDQLEVEEWEETARDKVILVHLGNGASLGAVNDGKSVDTLQRKEKNVFA